MTNGEQAATGRHGARSAAGTVTHPLPLHISIIAAAAPCQKFLVSLHHITSPVSRCSSFPPVIGFSPSSQWNGENKGCSFTGSALNPDMTAVRLHDVTGDC